MRLGPAANVARLNVNEIITALWSFANAQGLLTDDINERTGGAGVTIDGARLLNGALDTPDSPSAGSLVLVARVLADVFGRFTVAADGMMLWGDGTGARDTNLFRQAADTLRTDDSFTVGGTLGLLGDLGFSSRNLTLTLLNNNNVASGAATVQRITLSGAGTNITGFAGGFAGRLLVVVNLGGNVMTLTHVDGLSVAANRMILPDAANYRIEVDEQATLFYDFGSLRWRLLGVGSP